MDHGTYKRAPLQRDLCVLFSEGQKNICSASLDVEFHKLPNCFFLMPYLFFLLRYRCSKSAVFLNSAHKHRAHNFRRQCIYRARTHIRLTIEFKTNVKFWKNIKAFFTPIRVTSEFSRAAAKGAARLESALNNKKFYISVMQWVNKLFLQIIKG